MKKSVISKSIAICLMLSIIAITAATMFIYSCSNSNIVIAIDDNGKQYLFDKTYAMPKSISLIGSESGNEKSITLRATVTPSNATYKALDWSVAWSNPANEWVTGKLVSDYLKTEANGDTVTIEYKNAFAEPIILTARSKDNPDAAATCVVNCMRRPTAFRAEFKINASSYVTIDAGIIRVRLPGAYGSSTASHGYSAMSDLSDINYVNSIEYSSTYTVDMGYKITLLRGLANRKFNDNILSPYDLGQGEPYLPYSISSDEYNGRELRIGVDEIVRACFGYSISSENWFTKIDSMANDINAFNDYANDFNDYAAELDIHFEATNGKVIILSFKVYFTTRAI